LAKNWEMTKAKLFFKEKSKKRPWLVLLSADFGSRRVLEYSREK